MENGEDCYGTLRAKLAPLKFCELDFAVKIL